MALYRPAFDPLGQLDFVLRALWPLRPFDPPTLAYVATNLENQLVYKFAIYINYCTIPIGKILIPDSKQHMGEFFQGGFFCLVVVTFFVTLRADLEDYFKCMT